MKFANLFDGSGSAGKPEIGSRDIISNQDDRARLSAFLDGGQLVMRTTAKASDAFDPDSGKVVPLSYATDGIWIWPCAASYYLTKYGIAPPREFLNYIIDNDYRAKDPSREELMTALSALQQKLASQANG